VGLATALFGVVFASVQTDMKRLLAYSSIENMGLLFVGMGLTLIFSAYDMLPMAALALTATLYHVASHACFKSLLFLGTGSVLHATRAQPGQAGRPDPHHALGRLADAAGRAGQRRPAAAGRLRLRVAAAAELPVRARPAAAAADMLIPVVAALIALVAALAGYTMVKFFGVIFLGQPREDKLAQAHDAGPWERVGMVWLAIGCVLLGLLPTQFIQLIDPVTQQTGRAGLGTRVAASGWLLAPNSVAQASYGPVIFLLGILGSFALAFCWCAGCTTGACGAACPGPAASPGARRACRTRPKASASRSGRSSSPSS
jgi:hydrogenase-4 component B